MKVLHILHALKYSGAEIMYVDAAPVFQSLGCELSVVATANELGEFAWAFEDAGYRVHHKPYPPRTSLFQRISYFYNFIKFLKTEKIDLLHIHSSATFWGMSLCAWIAGKKSVYTFHNVFPTSWYSKIYHVGLRWSSKHIFGCRFQTISDSVYTNEKNKFKNPTTKIYNWYGSNRYFPATVDEKQQARVELGISKEATVLISVGGCSHIKRHSEIIKALPSIVDAYPDCIYLHLGTGHVEDEEQELAKSLNVSQHVRFCGNQKQVRKYLIASDLYLMPSKHEGIPITTIEAMACKIPSILYNVPGLKDFNKDGQNSILIDEDYSQLAQSVISLVKDDSLKNQIAENAFHLVNSKFDMNTNANQIFKLYQS